MASPYNQRIQSDERSKELKKEQRQTVALEAQQDSQHTNSSLAAGKASPPDGGPRAWLQVAGAFFLFFNTWGVTAMFGVFQTYYQTDLLQSHSASDISWIGSIQGFLLLFGGALTGPFFDLGYLRTLLFTGTLFSVLGIILTSFCHEYWQFFLAQGVMTGIGFGCLFLPSAAIVSQYFTTKKGLAYGIAASGSSIGGVLYPILFRQMMSAIGFRWTTRAIALVMLVTLLIPLGVLQLLSQPGPATRRRDFFNLESFKSKPFLLFCIANFFGFGAIYIIFFYVQLYALEKTDMSASLASYLLCVINATSTLGRLVPNFIADTTGPLNVQVPFAMISGVLCFGWIGINTSASLLAFCCLYGFFAGSFVSLPGTIAVTLSPDLSAIGIQLGMAFTIGAVGLLIGEPIAGAILKSSGGWVGLQVFVGVLLATSGLFFFIARVLKAGPKLMVKA